MTCGKRKNHSGGRRRGTATVELAVCLPMLVFILLAAIQAADVIFLKQTLHVAGYEAVRVAIKRITTTQEALDAGEQVLNDREVKDFTVTFLPSDVGNAQRGDLITVTVVAPAGSNTVLPGAFYGQQDLTITTKMIKE